MAKLNAVIQEKVENMDTYFYEFVTNSNTND